MLKVNNISVCYGGTRVLWDISINIKKSETIAIIGSNGAGKTTLLKAIMNIQPVEKGTIVFKDKNIEKMATAEIVSMKLILVPEGGGIFPLFSVIENLRMGTFVGKEENLDERFKEVFELFPVLEKRKNQKAGTLSGGERQMLALGRSLIQKPDLLMIDEPSFGLAPEAVTRLFKGLEKIRETGMPIILIEQNIYLSLKFANRAYILENGRIVGEDESKNLLKSEKVKKAYIT